MARNPNKKRCKATNRKGKQCKNWAKQGYDVCHYHGAGGGAPKENKNAEKHGLFTKHLPKETLELVNDIESLSTIDILWDNIRIQYAAIIRSQKIMYVKDKEEMIKELKKKKVYEGESVNSSEIEYEFQFAWDRQATYLQAQSRAMAELRNMITRYDELLKSELATEEQKIRIEKLKAQTEKIKGIGSDIEDTSELRRMLLDE